MSPSTTSELTRHKLLETAFHEFYQHGFQGGSLNRIVTQAGITKGALFHHFTGKHELGYSVVREIIRPIIQEAWIEPLRRSDDPVAVIRKILKHKQSQEILCQGCPLNNLAQEMSPLDEEFRKLINEVYDEWREAFRDAFARGVEAGTIRSDVHPGDVAAFLVAALAGIVGTAKNAQSTALMTSAGAELYRYLDTLKP